VPLVNPVKYASAIEQKKTLVDNTSVKGKVIDWPPHVLVSAFNLVDSAAIAITTTIVTIALLTNRVFMCSLLWICLRFKNPRAPAITKGDLGPYDPSSYYRLRPAVSLWLIVGALLKLASAFTSMTTHRG